MTATHRCPVRQNATFRMLFLVFLGLAYLILGAFVFSSAELENEERERKELLEIENNLKVQSNLTEADFKLLVNTILKLEPYRYGAQWTFAGAFYFAITVVTTIGYGHCVPHTQIGKLVCVLYAIFGIPLWLITFQSMGERMNNAAKHCLQVAGRKTGWFSDEVSQRHLILFGLVSSFFTITVGIIAFANFENWSYSESAYYSVMTLSTIGFGDYVALQEHESLQQNAVYVAFSFVYIILGITVIGAFLNLTIVRLFMINPDCPGKSNDDARENLQNNYENNFSSNLKSDEESFKNNNDNAFSKPKCFLVGCDDTNQYMKECNKKSGKRCLKDVIFKHMSSIHNCLSRAFLCCCMRRKTYTIAPEPHEIATKDKSSLIFKSSSPYFSKNYYKNNNNNNKLQSQTEEPPRLTLSVFTSPNNKEDAENVIGFTPSSNMYSSSDKQGFLNVVCCTETSETNGKVNLSVKANNIDSHNIVTNSEVAPENVSKTPLDKLNTLLLPHCFPFVQPEEMRLRHQSCSLPNQVRNETETYKSGNRLLQGKPNSNQYRRTLLTKNTNVVPKDQNPTTTLNNKKLMPFKHRALAPLTRHNSDPQRIQDFCRQFSVNIAPN